MKNALCYEIFKNEPKERLKHAIFLALKLLI